MRLRAIRSANEDARQTIITYTPGKINLSKRFDELDEPEKKRVIDAVHDCPMPGLDAPYDNENSFGVVKVDGEAYLWELEFVHKVYKLFGLWKIRQREHHDIQLGIRHKSECFS